MEGISDIKIIGIDETRPPKIRKEPYIDVVFKFSHQAPSDWCRDFNGLLAKHPSSAKVKEKEGMYIQSWVRNADEIPTLLDDLKLAVNECSRQYIERIERSAQQSGQTDATQATGEQARLNNIISGLNFND